MNRPDPKQRERDTGDDVDRSTISLLTSMADTTWRMFVPPAITVFIGITADLHFHTKPWLTILSAIVGLSLSVALVRKQLRDIP